MASLLYLIPISLVLLAVAMLVFVWAVRRGQFEDLDTEGRRILMDDERSSNPKPAPPQEASSSVEES